MTLSLNEIEATAKKAARGAGYPWGLAEEAGKATRWLCAHDVDGCGALADLLDRIDGKDIAGWLPQAGSDPWTAKDGILCPLAAGAAISDRVYDFKRKDIRLGALAAPVFLAPFVALLAREVENSIEVILDDAAFCTDGERLSSSGTPPTLSVDVSIRFGGTVDDPSSLRQRADPDAKDWAALLAFAHRTYAPATEESRLKGAGSGLADND